MLLMRISRYLPVDLVYLRISSSGRSCRQWLYPFEKSFFTLFSKSLYQVCDICSIWEAAAIITWNTFVPLSGNDSHFNECIRSFLQEMQLLSLHIENRTFYILNMKWQELRFLQERPGTSIKMRIVPYKIKRNKSTSGDDSSGFSYWTDVTNLVQRFWK